MAAKCEGLVGGGPIAGRGTSEGDGVEVIGRVHEEASGGSEPHRVWLVTTERSSRHVVSLLKEGNL